MKVKTVVIVAIAKGVDMLPNFYFYYFMVVLPASMCAL